MNMNKSMMLMMLVCLGAVVLPTVIPAGWMSGGIGFVLLAVILLACCLPMIKMMMTGNDQECGKTDKDRDPKNEMEKDNIREAEIVQTITQQNGR